jgi:lipopolysaccharide transport system ATP-binding protein
MSSDIAIKVTGVRKSYRIYDRPGDRLKQSFLSKAESFGLIKSKQLYRDFWALQEISFEIKKGETFGIIGLNGSGKSTLLQIIAGTLNPTFGDIYVSGRVAALLELGSGFNPEFTGRENVYLNASILGLAKNEIDSVFQKIVDFADIGVFLEQPVKTYSSGMLVRLAFSVIAHINADILIVDEALAVGDLIFTQKCMRFLRKFMENGTLIFVSHDIATINNLCKTAAWLDSGRLIAVGNAQEVGNKYLECCSQKIYGDHVELMPIQPPTPQVNKEIDVINNQIETSFFKNIENSDGWKSGFAEISSVSLFDLNNHEKSVFYGGELVKLQIEARIYKGFIDPIIGFYLKDKLGQSLFGEHTYNYISHPYEALEGEALFAEFVFCLPLLPNGDYALTISVAEGDPINNIQHHWLHDAVIVTVSSPSLRYGLVGIPFDNVTLSKRAINA